MSHWWCCCNEHPCDECLNRQSPDVWQVTLSEIDDSGCPPWDPDVYFSCADLNDSFLLDRLAGNFCAWQYQWPVHPGTPYPYRGPICPALDNYPWIVLRLLRGPYTIGGVTANHAMLVTIPVNGYDGTIVKLWYHLQDEPFDCLNLSGLELTPYLLSYNFCGKAPNTTGRCVVSAA